MPPTDEEIMRNAVVLIARKTDYLQSLLDRLRRDLRRLPRDEEALVREGLTRIVSELDPRLFLTETEVSSHTLDLDARLEDLNRDDIWRAIEPRLVNE